MSTIEGYGYNFIDLVQTEKDGDIKKALNSSGGSLLMALAILMGNIADKMLARTMDLAQDLDNLQDEKAAIRNAPGGKDPGGMGENHLTAQLQAQTQLMSQFMQAMTTVIKTVGEANKDVARKQ